MQLPPSPEELGRSPEALPLAGRCLEPLQDATLVGRGIEPVPESAPARDEGLVDQLERALAFQLASNDQPGAYQGIQCNLRGARIRLQLRRGPAGTRALRCHQSDQDSPELLTLLRLERCEQRICVAGERTLDTTEQVERCRRNQLELLVPRFPQLGQCELKER